MIKNEINITELPIGYWTDKFKENIEQMIEKEEIKKIIDNGTTGDKINYTLVFNDKYINIDDMTEE